MALNNIEEIIADIRQGRMVVLMDDEDRENEGDLIMAASQVRAEDINFMARYGRGLICLTLTAERCRQYYYHILVRVRRRWRARGSGRCECGGLRLFRSA